MDLKQIEILREVLRLLDKSHLAFIQTPIYIYLPEKEQQKFTYAVDSLKSAANTLAVMLAEEANRKD